MEDTLTGPSTGITGLNSSYNVGTMHGSSLTVCQLTNLTMTFCMFEGNSPANCLVVDILLTQTAFSCVGLVNNSCKSVGDHKGLVWVGSDMTFAHFLFRGNTADRAFGITPGFALTLDRCVFDVGVQKTGAGSMSMTACVVTVGASVAVASNQCPWPDPTVATPTRPRTQTPPKTATKSRTPTASQTPFTSPSPSDEFTEAWTASRAPGIIVHLSCFALIWNDW
jgi:hypothetical protein